jgi:hypothetical protein
MTADLEVRSFRSVFALERRIYRIDTLRLNPGGIPLRGIGYATSLVLAALVAGAVPPTAWLNPLLPWYVRDIGAPLAAALVLGALRVDGRPFHSAAVSLLSYVARSRTMSGFAAHRGRGGRWHPPSVLLLPDGSDACFRRLRYRGPGAVLVTHPHVRSERKLIRRADVTLHPVSAGNGGAQVIELAEEGLLDVRSR